MEVGGVEEELLELQETILSSGDISAVVEEGRRRGEVHAKPSGNNSLTFFMNDDVGEEEEEEMVVEEEEVAGPSGVQKEEVPRERELTQRWRCSPSTSIPRRYLAGQLSFKDLMHEMKEDEEDVEEEEAEETDDEEWRPPAEVRGGWRVPGSPGESRPHLAGEGRQGGEGGEEGQHGVLRDGVPGHPEGAAAAAEEGRGGEAAAAGARAAGPHGRGQPEVRQGGHGHGGEDVHGGDPAGPHGAGALPDPGHPV